MLCISGRQSFLKFIFGENIRMNEYNISYEIASAFFISISIAVLLWTHRKRTERFKRFLILEVTVLFGLIFDVLGAVSLDASVSSGKTIPLLFNSLYFLVAGYVGLAYMKYTLAFIGVKTRFHNVMKIFHVLFVIAYAALLAINIKTGWIFYIDDEMRYIAGPFHFIIYIPAAYFITGGFFFIIAHRKNLGIREMLSLSGFVFIILGTLIQALIIPNVLLTFFFGALAVTIILVFVETPDYAYLQEALSELDSAKIEAEKAKHVKSEFLSFVSRELKTPMNTVLGMDEMILRESRDEYISGYARDIATAGNNLMETLNKILDYSDIETGKLEIVNAPYKVSTVVREVYKTVVFKSEEKGLKIGCDVGSLVPDILVGDCVRIRQIMINLMTNAIKYTNSGSVNLYVGSAEIDDKNIMMEIRVSDTGIGIREEDLDKIFGTFDRAGDTHSRSGEGVGLGLSIVARLTDMMNGEIKAESTPGKGSVFIVKIPQKIAEESDLIDNTAEDTSKENAGVGPLFKAPNAKVLIVDDNDINRVLEAMLLKETEVQTAQVGSGEEMLSELARTSYDVILLDHIMPDMDGVEAMKRAKQIERVKNASTSFIALTANTLPGARDEYLRQGFDDFVSKPVNGKRLEEAVMKQLNASLILDKFS